MQQFSQPANPVRWRPRWAVVVAVAGVVLGAFTLGVGLFFVISDLVERGDPFDGLVAVIGGMIGTPGLLTALPFAVFLARRGGKVPFFLGLGVVAVAALWLLLGVGLRLF